VPEFCTGLSDAEPEGELIIKASVGEVDDSNQTRLTYNNEHDGYPVVMRR